MECERLAPVFGLIFDAADPVAGVVHFLVLFGYVAYKIGAVGLQPVLQDLDSLLSKTGQGCDGGR
jgi:hypothetical protein